MQATLTAPPGWDIKLIVPFVNSVRNVFTTMLKTTTTIERPRFKDGTEGRHDVSGIIGFSGGIVGTVVIGLSTEVSLKLVKVFAGGLDMEFGSADFNDAVGELANMIAGSAKKNMGVPAGITVPTVIIGSNHRTAQLTGVPCVVLPCTNAYGNFDVEVNIKQNNAI
jgi:chemotaxis protein CheX